MIENIGTQPARGGWQEVSEEWRRKVQALSRTPRPFQTHTRQSPEEYVRRSLAHLRRARRRARRERLDDAWAYGRAEVLFLPAYRGLGAHDKIARAVWLPRT